MTFIDKRNLTSLVASRICHDLINPIGAIGNGVELLSLSGQQSEEVDLIAGSVSQAGGRIRLFRLAFGAAGKGQNIAASEIKSMLKDVSASGRTKFHWEVDEPAPRDEVQAALLVAICIDTALVAGGTVAIARDDSSWTITGAGRLIKRDPALWGLRDGTTGDAGAVTAASVQFLLLPGALNELGRTLDVTLGEAELRVRF